MKNLSTQELAIIELLADAFVAFHQLPVQHPKDEEEFVAGIHALQALVMARLAVRVHPEIFHT